MDALLIMLRNVILFVALALPGFLLVKSGHLKQEQSGALSKLLMYVGMPFLILASAVNNLSFTRELLITVIVVALAGVAYTLVMFFVSLPLTGAEKEAKTRGMLRFCAVFSNNGFLGIPLAVAVFGAASRVLTVLIILNIITNVLMYTLGIYLVSGDKSRISLKKAFLNPVLIAFLIGMVLNLLNVKAYVPEISTYATHFSNLVTPISMTILGMKLGAVKITALFASWKTYYVAALKLIVFPLLIVAVLLAARAIFPHGVVNADMILGFFIAFAMPTAGLASTFADGFGGDTKSAVAFTLGTTLLSIITLPVLYWLLCLCLN
ncbi:MAG: AEC family transporter [Clostridia bacterium]|nr:AEC family transporter [Clostridia bacterium]